MVREIVQFLYKKDRHIKTIKHPFNPHAMPIFVSFRQQNCYSSADRFKLQYSDIPEFDEKISEPALWSRVWRLSIPRQQDEWVSWPRGTISAPLFLLWSLGLSPILPSLFLLLSLHMLMWGIPRAWVTVWTALSLCPPQRAEKVCVGRKRGREERGGEEEKSCECQWKERQRQDWES